MSLKPKIDAETFVSKYLVLYSAHAARSLSVEGMLIWGDTAWVLLHSTSCWDLSLSLVLFMKEGFGARTGLWCPPNWLPSGIPLRSCFGSPSS